jgi:hypothetical protein
VASAVPLRLFLKGAWQSRAGDHLALRYRQVIERSTMTINVPFAIAIAIVDQRRPSLDHHRTGVQHLPRPQASCRGDTRTHENITAIFYGASKAGVRHSDE